MEALEKGIYQYDLDGVLIAKYDTFNDITENKEYLKGTIFNAITGNQKTAYGYKWLKVNKSFFSFHSKKIIDIVLKEMNLDYELMIAKTRKHEVVRARQLIHFFLKKETKLSLSQIGLLTGGQDHTTIIHSCKKIKGYLDINDLDIMYYVNVCQKEINKIMNFNFKMWVPVYEHSKLR